MLFKNVAIFFDRIETTSSRTEMTKLLAELIAEASPKEAQHIVYFSLGTLNPPYISTQFNIAQKSMLKIVAHALHQTLEHVTHGVVAIGDVGEYFAQHAAQENEHMLRVEQLYILLQEFEQMSGAGSQEQKLEALVLLLANVSALEGKYIIRIILGTLRLGFSEMTLIDALSWVLTGDKKSKAALEEAYNLCADLGRVTYVAKTEGLEGIRAMSVLVGVPIRLAAAERLPTAQDIIKKLGVCIAEPKIDGFRLQIHKGKKDGKHFVRFFFTQFD